MVKAKLLPSGHSTPTGPRSEVDGPIAVSSGDMNSGQTLLQRANHVRQGFGHSERVVRRSFEKPSTPERGFPRLVRLIRNDQVDSQTFEEPSGGGGYQTLVC